MSYADFLAMDFENNHVEWVNGKVIDMPPISGGHQDVGSFLITLINTFVVAKNLGTIKYEPFQMKTGPDLPGRSPDILFVASAHSKRLKKTYLQGPADLVVEIISPESVGRDRGEKFSEYERGGIPEYWLIDPLREQAEFYIRNKKGIYQLARMDAKGIFHSTMLPGLWVDPEWFWKSPLPPVLSVMKLWGLV